MGAPLSGSNVSLREVTKQNLREVLRHLWRFMVDQRYQGMGFGARAIELLIEHVRGRPGATRLSTSCAPAEAGPGPFYEKLGFTYTGEKDQDELVMSRPLDA